VKPIETVGQMFDPNLHQAVASESVPGVPDGEIVEELRRGYLLGDRLLRAAMVKVAQA
jgi:molecular chaperone GrpE